MNRNSAKCCFAIDEKLLLRTTHKRKNVNIEGKTKFFTPCKDRKSQFFVLKQWTNSDLKEENY